ncbi:MAG: glycosyltransferase family 4 protein [Actinomycetota bacterium]
MAIIGPTHPLKGGVATHTTELAHQLADFEYEVDLFSWSRLYPSRLYPGEPTVPDGIPDVEPYPRTTHSLSWANPLSWWRVGRMVRGYDVIVIVHVVPALVPAHRVIMQTARGSGKQGRPRAVVVAHNVLPHESHPGAAQLVRVLLSGADGVMTHTTEQANLACQLGAGVVAATPLPPHLPGGPPVPRPVYEGPLRLVALGLVRPYKGIDLLLQALRAVPDVRLTIAGEMWGDAGAEVRRLAADPELSGRVEVRSGYVPATNIPALLAHHDVLALPYRSATASQNALLGFAHGLPVLATRTGGLADAIHDGVDGVLAEPGSVSALEEALRRLLTPGVITHLRAGVRRPDLRGPWRHYVNELIQVAGLTS